MVKVMFADAEYNGEILFNKELISYIEKNKIKSVAIFASAQFMHFEKVVKQLNEIGVEIILTKTKRTSRVGQILGCNIYDNNFERNIFQHVGAVIYIGDGAFHPSALLFAGIKNIIVFNPISNKMKLISKKDIEKQINKIKINLRKFINANTIGILVSLKPGQQHFVLAKKLKLKLKSQGKKAFIFVDNNFNLSDIENFNFIQCWVNTACPRIGTDDILNISKPIINIRDAFEPTNALESWD